MNQHPLSRRGLVAVATAASLAAGLGLAIAPAHAAGDTDTAAIMQLYTDDGVQMAPDASAATGREALRAAYAATFQAIALQLAFTVDEIQLLGKDTALLRSHSTGTLKVQGQPQPPGPAAFKELFVLRKQRDGQWKFSHYAFSAAPVRS